MKKVINSLLVFLAVTGMTFAEQNYVKRDGVVTYTNAATAVSAGAVVDLGDQYAVAIKDIAANGTGPVRTKGIYDFTLATNIAVNVGDKLYWDASSTQVTSTATADKYIGSAVEYKTTSGSTSTSIIQTWINPPLRPAAIGTSGTFTNSLGESITIVEGLITTITQ